MQWRTVDKKLQVVFATIHKVHWALGNFLYYLLTGPGPHALCTNKKIMCIMHKRHILHVKWPWPWPPPPLSPPCQCSIFLLYIFFSFANTPDHYLCDHHHLWLCHFITTPQLLTWPPLQSQPAQPAQCDHNHNYHHLHNNDNDNHHHHPVTPPHVLCGGIFFFFFW